MRLSASLLLLLAFSSVSSAQVPQVPLDIQERVLRDLAALWGVDSSDLEVEWMRQRGLDGFPFSDSTSFRLLGSERTGSYTVVFEGHGRGGVHSALIRAGVWRKVPVATRTLLPGDTVKAHDFTLEKRLHWGMPSRDSFLELAAGWIAQNTIRDGEVIQHHSAQPPAIIQAGSGVVVLVERNRVRIETKGTAMKDARRGEELLVKLEGDRGYVRAEAYDRGIVVIKES